MAFLCQDEEESDIEAVEKVERNEDEEEEDEEGEEEEEDEKITRNWSVLKTSPQLRKSKVFFHVSRLHDMLWWTGWIV